jgi:outer membrane protein OmpA-like peptidoglycan-associated protein
VDVSTLPEPARTYSSADDDALRAALEREGAFGRRFSLSQVRDIDQVRKLAPSIEVASIQFETGSSAIRPEEARKLADLGLTITRAIEENPNEIFLVEGHTDAVGSAATNLILSDRRAESLALALTEYFGVPPENLVVQGYGESDLMIPTDEAEAANRRAELRRITNLLQVAGLE